MQHILIYGTIASVLAFFVFYMLDLEFWQWVSLVFAGIGIFIFSWGEVATKGKSETPPK
jgi:hypothetical protein